MPVQSPLVGRRIAEIRSINQQEAASLGWAASDKRVIVVVLDNGTTLLPATEGGRPAPASILVQPTDCPSYVLSVPASSSNGDRFSSVSGTSIPAASGDETRVPVPDGQADTETTLEYIDVESDTEGATLPFDGGEINDHEQSRSLDLSGVDNEATQRYSPIHVESPSSASRAIDKEDIDGDATLAFDDEELFDGSSSAAASGTAMPGHKGPAAVLDTPAAFGTSARNSIASHSDVKPNTSAEDVTLAFGESSETDDGDAGNVLCKPQQTSETDSVTDGKEVAKPSAAGNDDSIPMPNDNTIESNESSSSEDLFADETQSQLSQRAQTAKDGGVRLDQPSPAAADGDRCEAQASQATSKPTSDAVQKTEADDSCKPSLEPATRPESEPSTQPMDEGKIAIDTDDSRNIWYWKGDSSDGHQDMWIAFGAEISEALEVARSRKEKRFKIDDERYIDLKAMRQRRYDNPSRQRGVKRETPAMRAAAVKRKATVAAKATAKKARLDCADDGPRSIVTRRSARRGLDRV